ncbi:ras-related protein Rab-32-like [Corticium candelabrum]|uniref:ras-related protein Rab-32-like n=1 Tax=Corticium candelabrum TaxID=121492 RepID=UPI002E26A173|nr:ras-related protein Rab-32-like [Corticium candelabrum]
MAAAAVSDDSQHVYKIVVIGESKVGKSSIVQRYVRGVFSTNYKSTLRVDFAIKTLDIDSHTKVVVQLWDLAGQDRNPALLRCYVKDAAGALVVFDVTEPQSFKQVQAWKKSLDALIQLPDDTSIPCVLLANKCDQPKSGIINCTEEMDVYCNDNGFERWFETSAKDDFNISEAFQFLVRKIMDYKNLHLSDWSIIREEEIRLIPNTIDEFTIRSRRC